MFSEYASRFLQQSNARLSFTQEQQQQRPTSRNPLDRRRQYAPRPSMSNPYQPSASQSRFPFASRLGRTNESQAPLFFSTTEDFPEEDDESEQHDRDVADAWALQRSRQHFGRSNLTESSELDDDGMEKVKLAGQDHDRDERGRAPASRATSRTTSAPESVASSPPSSKGRGRLVDVNLASTIQEDPSESLVGDSPVDVDEPPAPFQTFRSSAKDARQSYLMPMETDEEANIAMPRPPSPSGESVPPTIILPAQEPPKHDVFWANIFQISLFAMFAAFVLIWFHTSSPTKKTPLGDTIYSALRGSTSMLLWDTMIATTVALVWLALLRSYVRTFVYLILLAVPVILFSFTLYPLINSFRGTYHGDSIQDRAMRWLSPIPAVLAAVWTWQVILSRHSLAKSISILEFSTKILASSPYLIFLGFATLGVVVGWTWLWMLMFERIFLSGHFSSTDTKKWLIDANSWWLGAYFILQYLWTLGVIAGIQRTTTAATVSQWYFHRLAVPQPSSQEVVRASFQHATSALFGTTCLSTFLSLLVRLPLIILPGRLSSLVNMCAYWIIPTSLATLTNPLTLTYAAIHSQPLGIAARGLGQLSFISRTNPSNTMGPRNFAPNNGTVVPYHLAKLLLTATRYIMSFALGMAGWVRTAHNLQISDGVRGSLYAYIVGLVAGTIGFAVLGAVENVVGAVVDAAVICWASETGGRGEARFCREAGELFGGLGLPRVLNVLLPAESAVLKASRDAPPLGIQVL
ncbi:hypothetical protein BAUCODRAFT_139552 [Baudoinia panamericana UAMH 10762]|uniref:Protein PNS1 n=1 Tax=Baudoinia panamericana (strain UAMH 10762) TaxID=717646 RepID=M2MJC8_BAUPA|nr:uncharacterized protein BAUCODRAFT_139552 [Baudoinia panamericana UAMH 10762]EMC96791.1 hypothetical protein BAUCODRAFT_139552 [Baudoinia panamericana UAMH 10762]